MSAVDDARDALVSHLDHCTACREGRNARNGDVRFGGYCGDAATLRATLRAAVVARDAARAAPRCEGCDTPDTLYPHTYASGAEAQLCATCLEDARSDPGDYDREADED